MPPSRAKVVRTASVLALAGAAVASARALIRPRDDTERRLLDWEEVLRVAGGRSGEADRIRPLVATRLAAEYDGMASALAPLMAEVCGQPPRTFPHFTVLDRHGFIEVNLDIVRRLLAPVEKLRAEIPESFATAMSRRVMSRYVGEMFGFMSQRVLGQYDPVLMLPAADSASPPATALYLVEPNVSTFQHKLDVPADDLRRWLILHELTHAWQFEMHPWLGEHLGKLMNDLLMSGLLEEVRGNGASKLSAKEMVQRLPSQVRTQLRGVGEIQAIMSVLEGYSNFVMHRVGRGHIARFDELEKAFHKRKSQRSLLERLVLAITGVNMKLRQYEVGERFCEAVTKGGGDINRVWEGPKMMPSMAELKDASIWLARTRRG
ncbi:MAG: zinc-dependent metalloprotease [Candidatus Dormibacteria bacterium]